VSALPPGSTIGILGGGQLARMLALAAGQLGLKCHIYAPEKDSPAFQVSATHSVAQYTDESALLAFAQEVDVVTYEFENVPVAAVEFLEKLRPVRPGSKALSVAQDRLKEKWLARDMGAMTADFTPVDSLEELRQRAGPIIEYPSILKTTRFGYDGKGQAKLHSDADIDAAWAAMNNKPAILEGFVHFDREISVICARGLDGSFAAYEPTENVHRNHILHTSTVPAELEVELAIEAVYLAQRMADTLDYVGVMGVEFFVGRHSLYVNEIAPRVHNSGHWTQDACGVSQFEQHIRAVAGWPLGATARHSDVVMTNLLGDEINQWQTLAGEPGVAVHVYGKAEARPGRKMGHFNRITPRQG
jgi:5-(carboxyamino)imidazole ribonucleotide synthase